jgi:hypothetical protein
MGKIERWHQTCANLAGRDIGGAQRATVLQASGDLVKEQSAAGLREFDSCRVTAC